MITATCYTPVGLLFDPERHVYSLDGQSLLNVTGVLLAAALVDRTHYTIDDRERGSRVHRAIERRQRGLCALDDDDEIVARYVRAFDRFLAESAYRIDACEERVADRQLRVGGTLDLRGQFVEPTSRRDAQDRIDLVDVKTGTPPPWVGYQLAGYQRLLPSAVRARCRRWSLTLRYDGTYRLRPHANPNDEGVFLAACTIASAKRGWL